MMSELLASYWRIPVPSNRHTKTAYLDLFDNGISANLVVFVDRWRLQIPKWVVYDLLGLARVVYPDAPIFRRQNPERVKIETVMHEHLVASGYCYEPKRYDPKSVGVVFPDVAAAPCDVFGRLSKADRFRWRGNIQKMIREIVPDVFDSGSDITTRKGRDVVTVQYGWSGYEQVTALWAYNQTPDWTVPNDPALKNTI